MPHRSLIQQRLSFSVVSAALVLIVAIGLIVDALRPLIGLPEPNELAESSSAYLRQASHQRIKWRQLDDDLFIEARRLDRPLMVVVGAAWSKTARLADELVFTDLELRVFLNRDYLCARVDIDERPDWANAFYPLSRARTRWQADYQIWILEPDGRPFESIRRKFPEQPLDPISMRGFLQNSRRNMERKRRGDPMVPTELAALTADVQHLQTSGNRPPEAGAVRQALLASAGNYGGFPVRLDPRSVPSFQPLAVQAWRFLMQIGDSQSLRTTLGPALRSPVVDWIDGGFRRQGTRTDWRGVELDKTAYVNAEMAALLARTSLVLGDPYQRALAVATCETLTKRFAHAGLVPSARIGAEGYRDRGSRSSFGPARLAELLDSHQQEVAFRSLNLNHVSNSQMLPYIADPKALADPDVEEILAVMRDAAARIPPDFRGLGYTDINALVAARLMEAGRLLELADAVATADSILDSLNSRIADREVLPHNVLSDEPEGFLSDYLAYADACLQRFLAKGDPADFQRGHRRLTDALKRFQSASPFALSVCTQAMQIGPTETALPEVVDNFRESTAAMAIRLAHLYGVLTLDLPDQERLIGAELIQWAGASAAHFTGVAFYESPMTMGLFVAAQEVESNTQIFVVGANAPAEANRLAKEFPTHQVIPVGHVRKDLANREPGVYVSLRNDLRGPLSVAEARTLVARIQP